MKRALTVILLIALLTPMCAFADIESDFQIGNHVFFGHYPQSRSGNDNTPIEWLVLEFDKDSHKALLLSLYGLDAKPFHNKDAKITWENCDLRKWLNNSFLNKAFTTTEQDAILLTDVDNGKKQGYSEWNTNGGKNTKDKIFLLSYAEAKKYFSVTLSGDKNVNSRVEPTAFALKQGAYIF